MKQSDRSSIPASTTARASCPPVSDLAAYIDRRATGQEADAIAAHLASCPGCLDLTIAAWEQRDDDEAIHARESMTLDLAARLYSMQPVPTARDRIGVIRVLAWGLRAAAVIAVSAGGYLIGQRSLITPAPTPQPPATASRAAIDPTFGLFDDAALWSDADAVAASFFMTAPEVH